MVKTVGVVHQQLNKESATTAPQLETSVSAGLLFNPKK